MWNVHIWSEQHKAPKGILRLGIRVNSPEVIKTTFTEIGATEEILEKGLSIEQTIDIKLSDNHTIISLISNSITNLLNSIERKKLKDRL
jgi:hypothetical protein